MNGPECWETRRHRFRNGRCDFCGTPEASDSYAQGQRDMLAKCIAAVGELPMSPDEQRLASAVLAALRELLAGAS